MQKIEIETREKRNLIFSIVEACIVIVTLYNFVIKIKKYKNRNDNMASLLY